MRIVTWNCNMAAHRKLAELLSLRPDVVILPECAAPDVPAAAPLYAAASSHSWTGTHRTKGIAVLGFGQYVVEVVSSSPATGFHALPVRVRGPTSFNLLGLWTQGQGFRAYVESAEAALRDHEGFLRDGSVVVAGDFNSNARFGPITHGGHMHLVQRLEDMGLLSPYPSSCGEAQGAESRPTFFQNRHRQEPYHLDYVFVPKAWASAGCTV